MNRPVRTVWPLRVTSRTSTTPRDVVTSTRRPARVARDLERLDALPGVDQRLDPIALHGATIVPSSRARKADRRSSPVAPRIVAGGLRVKALAQFGP